jgi:hypothetical protein
MSQWPFRPKIRDTEEIPMTELSEMIQERVALIREASLENLNSAAWLEHELLPRLGLRSDAKRFLPACL